jgi:hypothetical protein
MGLRDAFRYPGTSKGNTLRDWRKKRKKGRKPKNIGGTTYKNK